MKTDIENIINDVFPDDEILKEYSASEIKYYTEDAMKQYVQPCLKSVDDDIGCIVESLEIIANIDPVNRKDLILDNAYKLSKLIDEHIK